MNFIKNHKKIFITLTIFFVIALVYPFIINFYIKSSTKNQIISLNQVEELNNIDAILILGCSVKKNGLPSDMLKDRLTTGFNTYEILNIPIIVTGDHGQAEYDEVNTMKQYLIDLGIPSENIFMDHAGFSTYDSIYRAKEIFEIKNLIVITQEYHLYRALYIGNKLNINSYGIKADINNHIVKIKDHTREFLARNKDFVKTIFKPESTYLGEAIPVTGNGDITNDK